jgi:hypothetical protein
VLQVGQIDLQRIGTAACHLLVDMIKYSIIGGGSWPFICTP